MHLSEVVLLSQQGGVKFLVSLFFCFNEGEAEPALQNTGFIWSVKERQILDFFTLGDESLTLP